VHGREAVPAQWRQMILSCRALPRCSRRPRPPEYWPVDVLEVAERLLLAGEAAGQVERPAPPYRAALPTA
jgi:hypothetical protein